MAQSSNLVHKLGASVKGSSQRNALLLLSYREAGIGNQQLQGAGHIAGLLKEQTTANHLQLQANNKGEQQV
jgi:hypothetical protein